MNAPPESLQSVFNSAFTRISQALETFTPRLTLREVFDSPTIEKMAVRIEAVVAPVSNEEREEMEF